MRRDRSRQRLVHCWLDVKAWLERDPSVDEVRPGQCPACGAASQAVGRRLGLWGHGRRERQSRGPLEPGSEPETVIFAARRYRCRACGAVVIVVPRSVLERRLFSAEAIALALVLFGVLGLSMAGVRERVSPWRRVGRTARLSWVSLRRWIAAIRAGRLFAKVRRSPARFTARQVAERAAMTLAALAPASLASAAIDERVFAGAALSG